MIRLLVVQASRLVFWISTPCAAGTQLRHVNLQRPEVLEKWRQQVSIHRRLWCSIGKVLSEFSPKKFLAVQEWPEHNSFWGESTYLRVAKKLGLERAFLVKRCCLDGIEKQWWLATNRRDFSEVSQHLLPVCSCTSVEHVRPTEKWRQQVSIHRRLWCSIGKVLSEFSPKKLLAVQEWPEHNSFWGESTYLRVAKKLGLERAFLVKRCCLDGIEKQWWLATNRRDFSEVSQHLLPVCSCTSVEHVRPTVTGFYSMEVVKYFWRLIQNYLKKGRNILPNLESSAQTSAEVNSAFNIPAEDHNAVRGSKNG